MTSSTKPEVHNARGRPSHVHRQHAQKLYIFWPCGFWVMACEVSDRQKNRHTHHKTLHRSPWTKQKSETEATNGRRYSDDCITQGEKLISARGTIHWCRRIVSWLSWILLLLYQQLIWTLCHCVAREKVLLCALLGDGQPISIHELTLKNTPSNIFWYTMLHN